MFDRLLQLGGEARGQRWLGILIACVMVTSIASIGQVNSRSSGGGSLATGDTTPAGGVSPGGSSATTDTTAPGAPGDPGAVPGATPGSPGAPGGPGSQRPGGTPNNPAPAPGVDFGLRTQGVTAKEVKLGISYNVAACGDAGTLSAAAGAATTGDMQRAIDAFTRHVNDTGGIAGRTLKMVVADDGGGGCPEKALAAARELVDDKKVFAVIPGLHTVADYVASQKIPTFIGRDDPASLKRYGANGIGLTQEIEGNLTAWAAFGKNYLNSGAHKPCLIHPEAGDSGDWPTYEKILLAKMAAQGLHFTDIVVYKEDVATAQEQAGAAAVRMKDKGCDQVWFMAGNPIAAIFFTQAATKNVWFPLWTFTSYMVLSDTDLGGRLMDQQQWKNAVGLSTRVKPGEHPMEGNCKRIYEHYYPNDGESDSVATQLACALILSSAEVMRRGVAHTGRLDANSLLIGADSITNDFYYDAHVPLDWRFPGPKGPFKTKAWSHYTVVKWNSTASTYDFPEYPIYWEVMGPNKGGGVDLRPYFKNK